MAPGRHETVGPAWRDGRVKTSGLDCEGIGGNSGQNARGPTGESRGPRAGGKGRSSYILDTDVVLSKYRFVHTFAALYR